MIFKSVVLYTALALGACATIKPAATKPAINYERDTNDYVCTVELDDAWVTHRAFAFEKESVCSIGFKNKEDNSWFVLINENCSNNVDDFMGCANGKLYQGPENDDYSKYNHLFKELKDKVFNERGECKGSDLELKLDLSCSDPSDESK